MKRTIQTKMLAAGLSLGVVASLVACAPNDSQAPIDSDRNSDAVVGITSRPTTLNSGTTSSQDAGMVAASVFDGLVSLNRNGEIEPMLATEWTTSDDLMTWEFTLRDDVFFHDGEALTAEDVKFTLDEVRPLSPYSAALNGVLESVEVTSDTSVVLNLSAPLAPLLNTLTRERIPILPEHVYGGTDILTNEANLAPIGTGPFAFSSWENPDAIVLERNDKYWGQVAELDNLIFRVIPDRTTLVQSLKSGEIDYVQTYWMPFEQLSALQGDDNLHVEQGRVYPTYTYLSFNVANGPLADEDVRAALFQAVDREYINTVAFQGHAIAADTFVPEAFEWGRDADHMFEDNFPFDADKAAASLDAAGYPAKADGNRFSLRYVFSPTQNPTTQSIGEVIQANFREIGVSVELISMDTAAYLDAVYAKRDYDLSANRLNTGGDPSLGIARLYTSNPEKKAHTNPSVYSNPEVDALWARVGTSLGEERASALKDVQKLLIRDLPSAPIIEEPSYDAISGRFGGLDKFFDAFEHASTNFNYLTLE